MGIGRCAEKQPGEAKSNYHIFAHLKSKGVNHNVAETSRESMLKIKVGAETPSQC